ncbi:MAG TPA: NADH-quinone oxidoreductase subunit NuoG [Symbiobacteriaceae bacterium]
MSELVTVTIDGRTVQVPKGTLLVEAAKQAGINIPVFCYHPKLNPAGLCRMCLVQIEKMPKPQAACTTRVADGMVVHTNTPQVAELRKGVLEFLLLNHPLDCPVCDKGGECDLQDNTFLYGPTVSRLRDPKIRKPKARDLGNFIVLDNERCILCRRCVRFDEEIAAEGNLIVQERGHRNLITTLAGEGYNSYFSGNTIELCPVGALTSVIYRFKARPWDLTKVDSVCTGCSVGCNLKQEFRFGELLRLTGRENPAVNDGWLCDRGRFNYRYVHSGERITQPLVKRDGQFVPVSWDEALAVVAEKFTAIQKEHGGKGFGVLGGGKLTNEEAYLLQKFARVVLGTNNVDHRVTGQVVTSLGHFPARQTDLSEARAILIVDTDPAEVAPVMDLRIRQAIERGRARLAAVGSVLPRYRARHARIAVRPGETAGVLTALAALAAGRKPESCAADAETLQKLLELLSVEGKVVIVWGGEDAATGRAVVELASSLRQVGESGRSVHVLIPGAQHNSRGAEVMGVLPDFLPGYTPVSDSRGLQNVAQIWQVRNLPAERGLDAEGILRAAAAGEVKALLLAGANLMDTFPDRKLAEAALTNAFVVAADLFLNDTVALADVVLPACAITEKSGSYTTLDGLVQRVQAARRPTGECRSDGEILMALARAMGARLTGSPSEIAAEIAKLVARLEDGAVLKGAPMSLLPAAEPATASPDGLVLVPVTKLYAGGSTARFDKEFNHVQPKPTAFFHPEDAARLGLRDGDAVELSASGSSLRLTAKVDPTVTAGTVQAIRGLAAAPVHLLTAGSTPVAVTVAKLAVEVAD